MNTKHLVCTISIVVAASATAAACGDKRGGQGASAAKPATAPAATSPAKVATRPATVATRPAKVATRPATVTAIPPQTAPLDATESPHARAKKVPLSAEEATAAAEKIYATICSTCHGDSGKGDGPAAPALNPKPRDYTDPKWQESISDEEIANTITEGGMGVDKSPLMPPNPNLRGPDQAPVLDALVDLIRAFGT